MSTALTHDSSAGTPSGRLQVSRTIQKQAGLNQTELVFLSLLYYF